MSLLPYGFVCLVLLCTLSLLLTFTLVLYTMNLSSERNMNMKKTLLLKYNLRSDVVFKTFETNILLGSACTGYGVTVTHFFS